MRAATGGDNVAARHGERSVHEALFAESPGRDPGDDYGALEEVVGRRYQRLSQEERVFPDLILIDGGAGQWKAAARALQPFDRELFCLLSLAKEEEIIHRGPEFPPLILPRNDQGLQVLQYVRDEAHRFAQHYHKLLRRKKTMGPRKAKKPAT